MAVLLLSVFIGMSFCARWFNGHARAYMRAWVLVHAHVCLCANVLAVRAPALYMALYLRACKCSNRMLVFILEALVAKKHHALRRETSKMACTLNNNNTESNKKNTSAQRGSLKGIEEEREEESDEDDGGDKDVRVVSE